MKFLQKSIIIICLCLSVSAVQAQDWEFGIGTGFYGGNFDGDIGLQTSAAGLLESDVRLTPSDTADLLESALGGGGFARNGRWTINFSYGKLELEDKNRLTAVTLGGGGTERLTFNKRVGELTAAYQLNDQGRHFWTLLGGFRYTNHEWKAKVETAGSPTSSVRIDESWSDVIVGIGHAYPLSQKLVWNSRLDYSAGDSEGVASFNTGLGWRFAESWSARFYASYSAVEFKNHSRAEPNYYLYDVDEFGAGVTILYHF